MFDRMISAMKWTIESGNCRLHCCCFWRRIAMRVSMSGGSSSATMPHSNRVTSRCSIAGISLAGFNFLFSTGGALVIGVLLARSRKGWPA